MFIRQMIPSLSRTFVAIAAILFVTTESPCQNSSWILKGRLGLGTYAMGDLKTMQSEMEEIYSSFGIRLKTIGDFPPYLNFQVQVIPWINDELSTGVFLDYASTGSRLSYEDYSGIVKVDMILTRAAGGVLINHSPASVPGRDIKISMQISLIFTQLEYREEVGLNIQRLFLDTHLFSAYGIGIEPGIDWTIIRKPLNIGLYFGGQLNLNTTLALSQNREAKLTDLSGTELKPNWSGARIAILIGHEF